MTHPIDWPTVGPRLLEALENMVKWFGAYPEFIPSPEAIRSGKVERAVNAARRAIAAAKGEDRG